MGSLLALVVVVSGCGFSVNAGTSGGADPGGSDDPGVDAPGAQPDVDAALPPQALPLLAASTTNLYALDVDLKQATLIGPVAGLGQVFGLDGLALYGDHLIGITFGGAELITIDPSTAAVTARITLTPAGAWGGLTVAPAGELGPNPVVFAGKTDDTALYRIAPATGVVTEVGTFGGGHRFFSDLAWVKNDGLYATLQGGSCSDICLASVDASTGDATVFRSNLAGSGAALFGLSGYRGMLWAFNSAGPVLLVNRTNGLLSLAFDPLINWTEAAQ